MKDERDLARAKDIFALARAIKEVLIEASKNFPEGKPKEIKIEWCRVTTLMIVELVKRKGVKYSTMVKQARKKVRRHFEREQARRLLKIEFPPLEVSNAVDRQEQRSLVRDNQRGFGRIGKKEKGCGGQLEVGTRRDACSAECDVRPGKDVGRSAENHPTEDVEQVQQEDDP